MEIPASSSSTFRILTLDGGGIRGAFIAAFLAKLESSIEHQITDYFDLITGTSTGGIIAIALSLGIPINTIREIYSSNGPCIFTPQNEQPPSVNIKLALWLARKLQLQLPNTIEVDTLLHAKYTNENLKGILTELFLDQTLGMAKTTRLVIPAIDLIKGSTVTFKTPHQPDFIRDKHFKAVDVALATSAAPTFFPAYSFNNSIYCDGGLWVNNPSVVGFTEAMKIIQLCSDSVDPLYDRTDVRVLSIGTGKPRYFVKPSHDNDGIIGWAPHLFEVTSGAQSQGAHFMAKYLVGEERYRRVDFDMPQETWPLDAVERVPELLHIGEEKAVDYYSRLKSLFFSTVKRAPVFYL